MSEEQIMQTQEDNAMDSSFLTPQSWFFSEPIRSFQVPVYQRLFAWKKPQFDRLLSDIKAHWEKLENKNKPYYLGIITVVKRDNQDNQYVLVDGQQRLTVLAILASMLETENRNPLASISNFLDYEARPADKKALQAIASSGNKWLIASETWTETDWKNVLDKENIASYSMREFVEHISKHKEDWTNCWANLKKGLKLFISELPEAYKTDLSLQNEYFEKMNSAGKQLEPHEILKVRICSEETFDKWNAIEDFTRKYTSGSKSDNCEPICLIQAIEQAPKTTPNNSAKKTSAEKWRPALIDFPMFLLHVLKLTLSEKYSLPGDSHKLLEEFENLQIDNSTFIKTMGCYRKFLDEWIIHKEVLADNTSPANTSSTENNFDADDSRFKYWQTNEREESVYLGNDDSQELKKRIKQIQMALYVLGEQQQAWLCEAYAWFRSPEAFKNVESLYDHLVKQLIRKAAFPDMSKWEKWPDVALTYGNASENASHSQFVCLDFFLWVLANSASTDYPELKKEVFGIDGIPEAIRKYVPRGGKSVEHFHPQTDTTSQNQSEWGAKIKDSEAPVKDIFGNLALISAGQNSKLGNMPVGDKSGRIRERMQTGYLESIKLYLMMQECEGEDAKWLPVTARTHAQKMLKVIRWGLDKFSNNKDQNNEGSQQNAY